MKTGEQDSIAAAGGMLLYLSRDGMMIYADEYPRAQDSVFGNGEIKDAIACSDGVRYYARLTVDGEKAIYRYDSKRGLPGDDLRAAGAQPCDGAVREPRDY